MGLCILQLSFRFQLNRDVLYIPYKGKISDRNISPTKKTFTESGNVCFLEQSKFFRLNPSLGRVFAVLRRCVIQSCISVVNLYIVDLCFLNGGFFLVFQIFLSICMHFLEDRNIFMKLEHSQYFGTIKTLVTLLNLMRN